MTPDRPLDPSVVAECHRDWKQSLERYAWAILRDWSLAADAVQEAFMAFSRFGGDVEPEARKSWMYKVVYRESLRLTAAESRYQTKVMEAVRESTPHYEACPLTQMSRSDELSELQRKISSLSDEQKTIVHMRIVEDKTFAQIAQELGIPLGTALSRMRLALQKLKEATE